MIIYIYIMICIYLLLMFVIWGRFRLKVDFIWRQWCIHPINAAGSPKYDEKVQEISKLFKEHKIRWTGSL